MEVFGEKHIWNLYVLPHFFEVWSKKRLVGKFFPVCLNCNPSVQRHFLSKSNFLLKIVEFGQLFRSLSNFACLLTKKSGYQGNNLLIRKKMEEKVCRKIVFFKSLSDSEQKILNNYWKNTRKIVRTTFKVFRGTILGRFSGMKKLCSSFLVVERQCWTFVVNFLSKILKSAAYGRNGTFWCFFWKQEYLFDRFWSLSEHNRHLAKNLAFGIVAKSAFHVSSAKLWEKNDKSNLYYHHLFWNFEGSFLWFW